MPFASRPGARLYYEDTGGTGRAIVFSHGILMDHEMFEPQVAEFAAQYRCVTWDERYHGLTAAEGPFTYWDSAEDLIGILDDAGIESAVLAGMSQGGFLSLRAALRHPDRVRAMFLIDSLAGAEEEVVASIYRDWAKAWAEHGPQEHLIGPTVRMIIHPAPAEKWIAKWRSWDPANVIPMFDALVEREDISDRLREIGCPAVVVHGTEDPSISMQKAEALCAGLPGCSEIARIEGGGHASNLSHPAEVNAALTSLLDSLKLGRA